MSLSAMLQHCSQSTLGMHVRLVQPLAALLPGPLLAAACTVSRLSHSACFTNASCAVHAHPQVSAALLPFHSHPAA